jgi:hypothetical protein
MESMYRHVDVRIGCTCRGVSQNTRPNVDVSLAPCFTRYTVNCILTWLWVTWLVILVVHIIALHSSINTTTLFSLSCLLCPSTSDSWDSPAKYILPISSDFSTWRVCILNFVEWKAVPRTEERLSVVLSRIWQSGRHPQRFSSPSPSALDYRHAATTLTWHAYVTSMFTCKVSCYRCTCNTNESDFMPHAIREITTPTVQRVGLRVEPLHEMFVQV